MATITRPNEILCEFLRTRVTDPRGRFSADSDSFTATAGQTVFTLTPTTAANMVWAITGVTLNSAALSKWADYTIDLNGKKITLLTATSLSDAVVVNYLVGPSGSNWIYPDRPISSMGKENFPRISVMQVNAVGARNGAFDSSVTDTVHFQIDVWTKKGYGNTISSVFYEEQNLADYLAYKVKLAFIDHEGDLYPKLYDYEQLSFRQIDFDDGFQLFRHTQELLLAGVNVGQ